MNKDGNDNENGTRGQDDENDYEEEKVIMGSIRHTSDVFAKRIASRGMATLGLYLQEKQKQQEQDEENEKTKDIAKEKAQTESKSNENVKSNTKSNSVPTRTVNADIGTNTTLIQQTLEMKWSIDESNENCDVMDPKNIEQCAEPCTKCRGTGLVSCGFCNGFGYVDFGAQERGTIGRRMMKTMKQKRRKERMLMRRDRDGAIRNVEGEEEEEEEDDEEDNINGTGEGTNTNIGENETIGAECPVCDENGDQTCDECKGSGWIANW
eukprot:CAMPEP_0204631358 /NCGR_PEP_ID=MMETSP0717-20131115/22492_1 /ASSEMBLY_ACC=CAM_ASM_000666 /TAXON_ID=230516 /ORGANISM="Chaetoceros curvisetus" /LENGTH=265 /DNA_ID=CAMNT_0051648897 /DNA_START=219 /DNA_END=1013 /DNA_ORIENTATION=+